MDTQLWGPPTWNLFAALVRMLYRGYAPGAAALPKPAQRVAYAQRLVWIAMALRYVLPCRHCRESYRKNYATLPPPDPRASGRDDGMSWVAWLWRMHNAVNDKLDRKCTLSLNKFRKRLLAWTVLIDEVQLWDLLVVVTLNYPSVRSEASLASGEPDPDPERAAKRLWYLVFFDALSACLDVGVPFLHQVAPLLSAASLRPCDVADKCDMVRWLRRQRARWAGRCGVCTLDVRAMRFADQMSTLYAVGN